MKEFDAFISHASEDKEYFVRPLCKKVVEFGAKIWYDEFTLKPGVSLSRSIEQGLKKSQFGLVVLSKSFFKKNWTEYELRALNAYEITNPGIIIPIWHGVTLEEVRDFSPYLSDKLAIVTENKLIEDVVVEVLEVIREDLFQNIMTRKAFDELVKKSPVTKLTPDEAKQLKFGPIRHATFSIDLITRIRLIRSALFEVYPHSFSYWVEGFQRDMHPKDEIHIWEQIASIYSEFVTFKEVTDLAKKKEIFTIICALRSAVEEDDIEQNLLTFEEKELLIEFCKFPIPLYDLENDEFGNNGS
ncbi:MAG: hypothetical protein CFE23_16710 [Flavobacterium sp. BFFFF1]|uniref:toll/interleukin-1 receptor domain-containing protein n=1 Tax=Flavobacterium sp. BFFFF1 TaxID=2015557 RepID=UPI000BDAAC37|nr:toll/interleukin-1 receptor domain-containing protein [Flavobacterium sp. BFFFF1]OYU78839.1 MAG: hypothetical protein CFE23_16710 [Flavobacterium sp. BFFFF1]